MISGAEMKKLDEELDAAEVRDEIPFLLRYRKRKKEKRKVNYANAESGSRLGLREDRWMSGLLQNRDLHGWLSWGDFRSG